jgi:hypothetical protein
LVEWYTVCFKLIDTPNTSKERFLHEYGIKLVRAYAYTKNEQGELTGIVFIGYRNRIDKNLKKERYRWGTQRKMKSKNLHKGMKIYIVETKKDEDTSKTDKNPKLRVVGSLNEMWLCRSKDLDAPIEKIRRLFPP